ncbi:MAG: hypothetical protein MUC49_15855 [Raineya sp.]|jgi:hypothetical protein|nr:hypothetical protein [Raineya sp.]
MEIDVNKILSLVDGKYSKAEALLSLLSKCGKSSRFGYHVIECDNSQAAFTLGQLALEWRWSKTDVNRFLKYLQEIKYIDLEAFPYATKITVWELVKVHDAVVVEEIQEDTAKPEPKAKKVKEKVEKINNEILFRDTPYYDNNVLFEKEFIEKYPSYSQYDIQYYYGRLMDWPKGSTANKYKKSNWLLTCKVWIDGDVNNGKPKMKTTLFQNQNSGGISNTFMVGNQVLQEKLKKINQDESGSISTNIGA